MKFEGTITRVQQGRGGITIIIETVMGLRGIELDRAEWQQVVEDFQLGQADEIIGWGVEYDPAHGDLEIIGPGDEEDDESDQDAEEAEGSDDHDDERTA